MDRLRKLPLLDDGILLMGDSRQSTGYPCLALLVKHQHHANWGDDETPDSRVDMVLHSHANVGQSRSGNLFPRLQSLKELMQFDFPADFRAHDGFP